MAVNSSVLFLVELLCSLNAGCVGVQVLDLNRSSGSVMGRNQNLVILKSFTITLSL